MARKEELTSCPDTSITSRSLQHATCTHSVPPCGWPWLAAEPHTIAPSLSPISRIRKSKSKTKQNTYVRDKSCLINKGKEEQRKKIKKWCKSHGSPPPTGKTDVHPTSKQWLHTKKKKPFSANHNAIWYGISLCSPGVSCPGCVPSTLLAQAQPHHCGEQRGKQVKPWCWARNIQQQLRHRWIITTVLVTNQK